MHTVDKLGTKVVRDSEQFLNLNGTYSDCWQRKDVWFYLRLIVRASHLYMLLCCVLAIICAVTGMYAKITIVTIGTIRVYGSKESAVSFDELETWRETVLLPTLARYSPNDIYR